MYGSIARGSSSDLARSIRIVVQRIEETCKRLRALLAQPADHSALWGVITVRVEPWASPLVDTTQIVAWLARRAAGDQQTCGAHLTCWFSFVNPSLHDVRKSLVLASGAMQELEQLLFGLRLAPPNPSTARCT